MQITMDMTGSSASSGLHSMTSVLTAPAVAVEAFTTSTTSSTPPPPSPSPSGETLVQLCKLWKHIHAHPPPTPPSFCPDILRKFYLHHQHQQQQQHHLAAGSVSVYDDRYRYQTHRHVVNSDDLMVGIDSMNELTFTGRSLSLLAVLGGVLFILLVVAFVTCIKHRKRVRDEEGDGLSLDMISSQLRQMHQARASQQLLSMLNSLPELPPAPPPDYDTVLKQTAQKEEQDLPSYVEATGGLDTVYEEADAVQPATATHQAANSAMVAEV